MAAGRIGIAAPFRWLQQSLALLRRHPRALSGATAVLIAVALLPTLLQLVLAGVLPGPESAIWIQGLGFVLSLLIYPPTVGGFYRVVHALDSGRETAPWAVLDLFGDRPVMLRIILVNLVFVVLTLLIVGLLGIALGGEGLLQFIQQLQQLKPGASTLPALPAGALPFMVAVVLVMVALLTAKDLASAEIALGSRPPLVAATGALAATLRNYGVFLLFYLPVAAIAFVLFMLVMLLALLLGMLLAVVSPVLAALVMLPLTLLMLLAMYALLFGFFYYGWRELFDTPPAPPDETHQLAA